VAGAASSAGAAGAAQFAMSRVKTSSDASMSQVRVLSMIDPPKNLWIFVSLQ
jgi:hypothetical protein